MISAWKKILTLSGRCAVYNVLQEFEGKCHCDLSGHESFLEVNFREQRVKRWREEDGVASRGS